MNLREMFPSYGADFSIIENADGDQSVEKTAKYPPTVDAENETQALDMLEFLEAIMARPHPRILSPLDFDAEINEYLVEIYKYIKLPTLDDRRHRIRQNIQTGGMGIRQVVDFVTEICGAVEHIHRLGFIHRDVRPRNIFVTPDFTPILFDYSLLSRPFFLEQPYQSMNLEVPPEANSEGMAMIDERYDVYQIGYMLRDLTHQYDMDSRSWQPIQPVPEIFHDITATAMGPLEGRYANAGIMREHLDLLKESLKE